MERTPKGRSFCSMDEFIKVAELGKPFALKGEIKAISFTSFPEMRFQKGRKFWAKKKEEEEGVSLTLLHYRSLPNGLLLQFEEIQTPEDANMLKGFSLYMLKKEAPLPDGYIRIEDLKGLKAFDQKGDEIGEVMDTMQNAPTLNLVLKAKDGHRFMVPFIDKKFILSLNLEEKTIVINVIPGLL